MQNWPFLVISIVITLAILHYRNAIGKKAIVRYGYEGVFLINLLGNATVLFPAPSIAATFVAGSKLNPYFVGVVAASGATLGETTGYMAGYGGKSLVNHSSVIYNTVENWMNRSGFLTLFILSALPNPFFDVAGIMSGVTNFPYWKFLIAVFLGKLIKCVFISLLGRHFLG